MLFAKQNTIRVNYTILTLFCETTYYTNFCFAKQKTIRLNYTILLHYYTKTSTRPGNQAQKFYCLLWELSFATKFRIDDEIRQLDHLIIIDDLEPNQLAYRPNETFTK